MSASKPGAAWGLGEGGSTILMYMDGCFSIQCFSQALGGLVQGLLNHANGDPRCAGGRDSTIPSIQKGLGVAGSHTIADSRHRGG